MIHVMHGNTNNFHMLLSETACGLNAEQAGSFVYWANREKADCPECLAKVQKLENMQAGLTKNHKKLVN